MEGGSFGRIEDLASAAKDGSDMTEDGSDMTTSRGHFLVNGSLGGSRIEEALTEGGLIE